MGGENPGEAVLMRNISVRKMNFRKKEASILFRKKMPAFALAFLLILGTAFPAFGASVSSVTFSGSLTNTVIVAGKDSIYSTKTHDLERLILQNITARVTYSDSTTATLAFAQYLDNITLWDASGNAVTAPQNLTAGNYTFRITIGSYKKECSFKVVDSISSVTDSFSVGSSFTDYGTQTRRLSVSTTGLVNLSLSGLSSSAFTWSLVGDGETSNPTNLAGTSTVEYLETGDYLLIIQPADDGASPLVSYTVTASTAEAAATFIGTSASPAYAVGTLLSAATVCYDIFNSTYIRLTYTSGTRDIPEGSWQDSGAVTISTVNTATGAKAADLCSFSGSTSSLASGNYNMKVYYNGTLVTTGSFSISGYASLTGSNTVTTTAAFKQTGFTSDVYVRFDSAGGYYTFSTSGINNPIMSIYASDGTAVVTNIYDPYASRVLAKGTYYIKLTSISFSWEDDSEAISLSVADTSISSLTVTGTSAGFLIENFDAVCTSEALVESVVCRGLGLSFSAGGTANTIPNSEWSAYGITASVKTNSGNGTLVAEGTKLAAGSYGIYFTMDSVTTSSPLVFTVKAPDTVASEEGYSFTSSAGTTLPAAKTVGSIKDISAAFTVSDYRKYTVKVASSTGSSFGGTFEIMNASGKVYATLSEDDLGSYGTLTAALWQGTYYLVGNYSSDNSLTVTLTPAGYLLGDIDGDDDVSVSDLQMEAKKIVGLMTFTSDQEQRGDVDSDGEIMVTDLQMIAKIIVQIPI